MFDGALVRMSGHAHDADCRLDHQVIGLRIFMRAGRTVAGNRAIDDGRIDFAQYRVIHAEPRGDAWTEIFDDDVGFGSELQEYFATARRFEVERHRLLAALS